MGKAERSVLPRGRHTWRWESREWRTLLPPVGDGGVNIRTEVCCYGGHVNTSRGALTRGACQHAKACWHQFVSTHIWSMLCLGLARHRCRYGECGKECMHCT